MPNLVCLGFDFGYKRIGVAVGQSITGTATPLKTIPAHEGIPDWNDIHRLINEWQPQELIVGLPTCIDETELYVTEPAKAFAKSLGERFKRPVHLVDERLTTIEARERLFAKGGYKKLKKTEIDCIAACIILEQWLETI